MTTLCIIGAGSTEFTARIAGGLLRTDEFHNMRIALTDIDGGWRGGGESVFHTARLSPSSPKTCASSGCRRKGRCVKSWSWLPFASTTTVPPCGVLQWWKLSPPRCSLASTGNVKRASPLTGMHGSAACSTSGRAPTVSCSPSLMRHFFAGSINSARSADSADSLVRKPPLKKKKRGDQRTLTLENDEISK